MLGPYDIVLYNILKEIMVSITYIILQTKREISYFEVYSIGDIT